MGRIRLVLTIAKLSKLSYAGIVEMAKSTKLSDKDMATLIIVRNEKIAGYFPLTNRNRFRIYLTEKMK
jgi:hypothetical protein